MNSTETEGGARPPWRFRTRAIHVGADKDPATGAVVPPIHLASTYVQAKAGEWGEYDYSRSGNPTRHALEVAVGDLEGGLPALCFASGMAATHCVTMLLETGDEVLAGHDVYGGTYRLLHKICNRSGVGVRHVDTTDPAAVEAAITPAVKLLWLETPGNPLMSITDLAALAEIARRRGVLMGVDNTFASPVLTRPLELGADVVMHSATKYLGGHSDLLGGALVVKDPDLRRRLYYTQNATGGVMSPFDAFLCSRGLKTLELRVLEQSRSALLLAERLAAHRNVARVLYPGLPTHPGHDVARRQMHSGFGGMLTFELRGGFEKTKSLVQSTTLFQLAVSLGAVESLI
ncbi:MAG: trans-sulfuration enzyme family protein, partial [Planctomycetia bacterium]